MPTQSWRFCHPGTGAAIDVTIQPRLTVTTPEAAAQAAIHQVGIARLLHYQAAEGVRQGALQILLQDYEPVPAPVHLLHVLRGQMPLKLRSFLDFAAPRLRQTLKDIAN
ncbi:hypothetical protein THUN1379_20950 [Paludibacterium sp. THUN1379]|nr:hypothetical protein THUN1379_20950 [Paludibacterium sp. THUN1379]